MAVRRVSIIAHHDLDITMETCDYYSNYCVFARYRDEVDGVEKPTATHFQAYEANTSVEKPT